MRGIYITTFVPRYNLKNGKICLCRESLVGVKLSYNHWNIRAVDDFMYNEDYHRLTKPIRKKELTDQQKVDLDNLIKAVKDDKGGKVGKKLMPEYFHSLPDYNDANYLLGLLLAIVSVIFFLGICLAPLIGMIGIYTSLIITIAGGLYITSNPNLH